MQTSRAAAMLVIAGLAAGCAQQPRPESPAPADLPTLEAAAGQSPGDAALITRLGIALYDARRYDRARDVLQSALALRPRNVSALVYLGLAYEELGRFDSARTSYTTAAGQAGNAARRRDIESRLILLTRRELQQAAREAVAQETQLSSQPPAPNAVAVFPFSYAGSNAELAPLGRGLTHLMVTDLSRVRQLTLLERERVQALVDELALNQYGRVDIGTGARSGRLLRAARVVQGTVQEVPGGSDLRLDATVVSATDASIVADGSGSDRLQQLFALEKQVLFRLLERMGISLTPAERREISERPTADLQAFLAFSRGLEAEDRGDYAAAEAEFSAALARDPGFHAARVHRARAAQGVQALALPAPALAGLGSDGSLDPGGGGGIDVGGRQPILFTGLEQTLPGLGTTLVGRLGVGGAEGTASRPPAVRPPLSEFLGSDNPATPGALGTIIIIITRP